MGQQPRRRETPRRSGRRCCRRLGCGDRGSGAASHRVPPSRGPRPGRCHGATTGFLTQTDTSVVRQQIVVAAPIEQAFTVFTERFGDFKPPDHNLLSSPITQTVFEPRVGGNITDHAVDGSQCRWARVLAYEPPDRVVFSWDIGPQWQIETNPDLTSEVEVRFFTDSPGHTRLELEHRHIDRHGSGWQSVADGVGGSQGWPLYLGRFAALFPDHH